jgi:amino-acid N-acetyltransferase
MTGDWAIRQANAADWPGVEALLRNGDLPTSDIDAASLEHFRVLEAGEELLGVIGLETHAGEGLVRSLVTAPQARSRGVATALYEALECYARTLGISRLWLLTESAPGFFTARGFGAEPRDTVPAWLAGTTQYRDLCPLSALVMSKRLD